VFGVTFRLRLLEQRAARPGRPTALRPAFRACPGVRIVTEEAVWTDDRHALTPNRFPFSDEHALLWPRVPAREPDEPLLGTAFAAAERTGAQVLYNSVGAAASIPHAHLHLVRDHPPALHALRWTERRVRGPDVLLVPDPAGAWPVLAVGLRSRTPAELARAVHRLLLRRLTPAVNLVHAGGLAVLVPRREETVPEHFPHAVGASEWAGRFLYSERTAFERATAADLEGALTRAGCALTEAEACAVEEAFATA
jgi:hypothetical protein